MIYFLYGPGLYRLSGKTREIINRYQEIHGGSMNLVEIEAKDASFSRFMDIYQQPSMFVENRLVVLKNLFQTPTPFQTKLQKEIVRLNQSSVIFLFSQEGSIKNHQRLFESLKQNSQIQEFPLLCSREILIWLNQEAEHYDLVLQPEACSKLANLIQGDLLRGHLVLEKIAAFLGGEKKEIDVEMVEKLTDVSNSVGVFEIINFLQNNQIAKALSAASSYFDKGGSVVFLIGQLNTFLAHLLVVRALLDEGKSQFQIMREVSFNPRSVYHLIDPAQRLSIEDLNIKLQDLFKTDLGVKTSQVSDREAINDFLLRFGTIDSTGR